MKNDENLLEIESYLYAAREFFWNGIKHEMEWQPTVSGYTTTKDCISQDYPFESTINSLLSFCDEVVVMDGGSSDGTYEFLTEWAKKEDKLKIFQEKMDWNHPHFPVFDGKLKDLARSKCSMEFCFQIDCDEILHNDDSHKIKPILSSFPTNVDLIALPVIEYWGGKDKVRADINPWKCRLSRNIKNIGHGIPAHLKQYDENGLYSKPGSDGCCYVNRETGQLIAFGNFYTQDVEICRQHLQTNDEALNAYQQWFDIATTQLPTIFHFSWWNIERKIHTYKGYWAKHWKALYNLEVEDTPNNNVMFNCSWKDVSDETIKEKAKELSEKTSGWIFHSKWEGQNIRGITTSRSLPIFIQKWVDNGGKNEK